jgi:hypothetical protein
MMPPMPTVPGYDSKPVELRYRAGSSVPYVLNWEDNALYPPPGAAWPPAVIRQVEGYVARKSWFAATDAEGLAARLGFIGKFQSLNSENAVTWSWFGTLALADGTHRRDLAQWLYSRAGIEGSPSEDVSVDQWMRVVHPKRAREPERPRAGRTCSGSLDRPRLRRSQMERGVGHRKGSAEGAKDDQVVLAAIRCVRTLHY